MTEWVVWASKRCESLDAMKAIDAEFKEVTGFSASQSGMGFAMRDVGCVVDGAKAAEKAADALDKAKFDNIHINIINDHH